ncbi:hypothetical protein Taro_053074, partial [Colocasia esculenta]|nr:hypothetical protein [Colocasia esculenta]
LACSTSSSTPSSGQPVDDSDNVTVLIDYYKYPFGDVCLCELGADDKLHLLSRCSHAFHLKCIVAWLVSHFTCPLCRSSLLPDASPASSCSPLVLILKSGIILIDKNIVINRCKTSISPASSPIEAEAKAMEERDGTSPNNAEKGTPVGALGGELCAEAPVEGFGS